MFSACVEAWGRQGRRSWTKRLVRNSTVPGTVRSSRKEKQSEYFVVNLDLLCFRALRSFAFLLLRVALLRHEKLKAPLPWKKGSEGTFDLVVAYIFSNRARGLRLNSTHLSSVGDNNDVPGVGRGGRLISM